MLLSKPLQGIELYMDMKFHNRCSTMPAKAGIQ